MKKRWLASLLVVIVIVLGIVGYQHRQVSQADMSITAVGSTALQPLVEAAGEDYSGSRLGSFINVQGGGSGTGLSQVQEGAVEIGNSDVYAEEQKGIRAANLVDHRVAVVGITPIVNRQNGITNLTTRQLIAIFTGKVTNWREVGGRNQKIVIINRAQGSGTRATFEKWALNGRQSKPAQEQDSSGMVRQIVATTPGAISYVGFSYVNNTVQAVTLNHVAPTDANVETNKWPIWSYEHMYTQKHPNQLTQKFIAYVRSTHVQHTLVRQLGYISMDQMQVTRSVNGQIQKVEGSHE
ncbi:phosphate ABC transporter substrate-binding protein [Secundilactobacillus paracollinoides]|uniref:Phosphate-binding protein n=1 Tax=Secundilactobacillus paracollinoides TaxID=240427 RepID=A0A1B2IZM7_9LACO|nr:phosphate ABC transporter substrate-binding protein PstS family protein [Secundilactobacillus paracollinoides]ANZ61583.1 phosphate ABC transporter substrate-binding protein [Secundilactobacillus paracollinoides]ANZ63226.1 phosphate ABC transporter substrate-binding protein [Secundilactobacillus paracollinoides]ANZ67502.1 phosphate ABC transporter substrate-binding protein [Secundilactobacillus paracollinoides]